MGLAERKNKEDPNWGPAHASLPHCPDFDERFTLADGKTRGVPYPQVGYNCTSEYQLAEKKKKEDPNWGPAHASLPHCPDFDERFTLATERQEVYLTHRLDTTAPANTNSLKRKRRRIQTGDQHMPPFLTAQTSMRDSPSLTVRPEVCHTHRLDTTAPAITNLPKRRIQTGEHHMLASNTAQTSMRDSPSP